MAARTPAHRGRQSRREESLGTLVVALAALVAAVAAYREHTQQMAQARAAHATRASLEQRRPGLAPVRATGHRPRRRLRR